MIVYEDCHFGEKGHRACYEFRDFSVVPHFHRSNELLYVEEGKIKAETDGRTFWLEAGDLLVVLPYEIHAYETQGPSKCRVAVFSPDYLNEFSDIGAKYVLEKPVISLGKEAAEFMQTFLFGEQENVWMSKAFLYYAAGRLEKETRLVPRKRGRSDLLHNILLYVQENFQQEISLSSLALYLGYSPVYCSRYLNHSLNQSFTDLVNRHRISYGVYLLEHTEDSVSDIAFACGYSAIRSFNRNFKALEGVTPREYRKGIRSAR